VLIFLLKLVRFEYKGCWRNSSANSKLRITIFFVSTLHEIWI